jgi:hypothetical protein
MKWNQRRSNEMKWNQLTSDDITQIKGNQQIPSENKQTQIKSFGTQQNHVKTTITAKWSQVKQSEVRYSQVKPTDDWWNPLDLNETNWDRVKPSQSKFNGTNSCETKWVKWLPKWVRWDSAPHFLPAILLSSFGWLYWYSLNYWSYFYIRCSGSTAGVIQRQYYTGTAGPVWWRSSFLTHFTPAVLVFILLPSQCGIRVSAIGDPSSCPCQW